MNTILEEMKAAGVDPNAYVPLPENPVTISYRERARRYCNYADSLYAYINKVTQTSGWGFFESVGGQLVLTVNLHNFLVQNPCSDDARHLSDEEIRNRLLPAEEMSKRYKKKIVDQQRQKLERIQADAESRKDFGKHNLRKANPKYHGIGQAILDGRMPWMNPDFVDAPAKDIV